MRFMKCKLIVIIILLLFIFIDSVDAQKGCCSWHGGVSGCSSSGRIICNDGSYSPSCTCTPTYNYGCMDQSANNYNSNANKDDGSCTYDVYGCLNSNATNYNYNANKSDGSCLFEKIVTEEVEINYTSDYRENTTLEYNEQKIVQKGIKGSKEIFYKVITNENGVEVSRDVFKEEVIKEPVDEIIEQNTTNKSSSNEVTTSSKKSGVNVSNSDISGDDLEGFFAFNVVIYFIFVIINWRYVKRHNNGDTILGKIKNNRGLVVMYYIFGIFAYLDIIIIVFATIYKNRLKKIHS